MNLSYFELIDRVVALDLDAKTIQVEANVPSAHTIFEGHFPGRPLMPGVLLCEAMAQTSGWIISAASDFSRMPFLAALKEAKMRSFVTPGQTLIIDARIIHDGSGYSMTQAAIRVDGKRVCDAELTFRHMPFPNDELRLHMLAAAERFGARMRSAVHV